jgi:hypothetical protein
VCTPVLAGARRVHGMALTAIEAGTIGLNTSLDARMTMW